VKKEDMKAKLVMPAMDRDLAIDSKGAPPSVTPFHSAVVVPDGAEDESAAAL
jgi:hypothetical protein